jgi:hypothetical protein
MMSFGEFQVAVIKDLGNSYQSGMINSFRYINHTDYRVYEFSDITLSKYYIYDINRKVWQYSSNFYRTFGEGQNLDAAKLDDQNKLS